jgi:glycosyltransferase involved in cell wall biosynthesis
MGFYKMGADNERVEKKSILCIVPLPPPITGAAIASDSIVTYLRQHHNVLVMPYQRGNLISGKFSLKQLLRIIAIGVRLAIIEKRFDSVYLVISSTFWGNLRDLFFLDMMGYGLRNKTVLHLHVANIDRYLSGALPWIKYLNKKMLGSVNQAIVLGETFRNIFSGYISNDKIRILKNYFKHYLLAPEEHISKKFSSPAKINILFLSNLIKEKGYEVLLDAFLSLPESVRNKATLHFAGEIYSAHEKKSFITKINNRANIFYYGQVAGKEKRKLLKDCHIFCLPTFYKFEGQPISILEAYASGCIVLTTTTGGINDIFINDKNGFFVEIESASSLREKLEMLIINIDKYKNIANFNFKEASEKYTEEIFCKNMEAILLNNYLPK